MNIAQQVNPEDRAAYQFIRDSPHFNSAYYTSTIGNIESNTDPALHYLLVGERAGFDPSPSFSASTYEKLNPDVAGNPINRLYHYEAFGRSEGRSITFGADEVELDARCLDPGKPTVIVFLHEATYSGAPILGWNLVRELRLTRNVVVIIRNGGSLQGALASAATALVGPVPIHIFDSPMEMSRLAERIKRRYEPLYAIANSTETRGFAIALSEQGVSIVALVHEFATHSPPYALKAFYNCCDALVFPADIVLQSSLSAYPALAQRRTYVLPQGPSEVPRLASDSARPHPVSDVLETSQNTPFTVVGMGAVDLRKGVDLFIAAATALKALHPDLSFRFIWIGERVHPLPHTYYTFLDEQIMRSGLEDQLVLVNAVDDLAPFYAAADAFFLSSRLDPLPNVGIDATLNGIPLLCFDGATGFAELLKQDSSTAWLVAPHLDAGAVANSLATLARDLDVRASAGVAVRRMGRSHFNLRRYTASLDALGRSAAQRRVDFTGHVDTLLPEDAFDAELYFGASSDPSLTREAAVARYLADTVNVDFSGPAAWGEHPRRALPGFNSLMYGRLSAAFGEANNQDPLAHFIASGRPPGPWSHQVIRLDSALRPQVVSAKNLRVAIHGHFHYTESFPDFLRALECNAYPIDLLITTTSELAAQQLLDFSSDFKRGKISIEVMKNSGRDIGPFLALLKHELIDYDLVAHIHGKRSEHTFTYDPELGNRWRNFLWQHLIGPAVPVADILIEHFSRDKRLGMVFPENDFLVGWEKNREIAATLATRFNLTSLPEHIEFPVGTMFWARPSALKDLTSARIREDEFPLEPLPIDGTMLHAMERMLPLIVENADYRYATTYFPQFSR
jgi:glycosyltransferase involved in cell wall biosynthesis